MNTDTELLRKLVAEWRDRAAKSTAKGKATKPATYNRCANQLEAALSRLLEAGVPEGQAEHEPDRDLWMRVAFYAIKAAEKQNGVRLIPMGDEDAEAFMDSIAVALEESLEEIMTGYLDEPHPPSEGEPDER